jgi:hypothetical protein
MPLLRRDTAVTTQCVYAVKWDAIDIIIAEAKANCDLSHFVSHLSTLAVLTRTRVDFCTRSMFFAVQLD